MGNRVGSNPTTRTKGEYTLMGVFPFELRDLERTQVATSICDIGLGSDMPAVCRVSEKSAPCTLTGLHDRDLHTVMDRFSLIYDPGDNRCYIRKQC